MAPIRYSLHYEEYSEHLMSTFGKLLQMQSLVDMTLMCSSHTLRVHKAVLAASSAYFQEVLQKQTGEPLIILKMRFSVLKCLVEFMYCGKTQCLEENLDELVSAAQFLKIKGLAKVTKEGLGIANYGELPLFTPPVVINRPPQSLIDSQLQEGDNKSAPPLPLPAPPSTAQPLVDAFGRPNKDSVVRIPFDIDNNGGNSSSVDYADNPRAIKPRRGRPTVRRTGGWDGASSLSRAAERALLKREQDSRKAIHQLKHLQTRHMQDYMDRVTLSQAVNSICGPETSNSYMNMDNDLMYMDQASSNIDPSMAFGKENTLKDNMPQSYPNVSATSATNGTGDGINNAMSQYVNALKSAGLPTDLPILFESVDGSYINVNEQVLLDMVQSSEIQYEVIEQPNIIEKVADPSEIKSIDDLSKSIERGEMMQGGKNYSLSAEFDKNAEYTRTDDGMNSLASILPDNIDAYAEQQNYVVMDPRLQENNLDHVSSNDFSCIDGDMQFFTKSMSDDVKKYYEDQQLVEARVMEQLCPASSSLDTNFSMSLLDSKGSQLTENLSQSYDTLNTDDLRRTEDCYDFTLPLPQNNVFKEDLDCLIATPRRNDDDNDPNSFEMNSQLARERAQAKADIIKDLMSIESKINLEHNKKTCDNDVDHTNSASALQDYGNPMEDNRNESSAFQKHGDFASGLSSNIQWDLDMDDCRNPDNDANGGNPETSDTGAKYSMVDLTSPVCENQNGWEAVMDDTNSGDKENQAPVTKDGLDQDIPFAVGLLPMKTAQQIEDCSMLKRRSPVDLNSDAKYLKRRAKKKVI